MLAPLGMMDPHMAMMQAAAASPPRLADPKIEQLKAMFPDLEADILEAFLQANQGDVERSIDAILCVPADDAPTSQQDVDEVFARQLQQEMDAEVARGVADEITREMNAEEAARRAQEPAAKAAAAMERGVEKAGAMAKSLLQRARGLSARGRGASSTHAVRLLDSPMDSSAVDPSLGFTPLQIPAYAPPPAQAHPAAAPMPDISDDAGVAPLTMPSTVPAATTPAAPTGEASATRYNSRLDRARSANALRSRQASSGLGDAAATPPPPPGSAAAPHVPVGELI